MDIFLTTVSLHTQEVSTVAIIASPVKFTQMLPNVLDGLFFFFFFFKSRNQLKITQLNLVFQG